MRNHKGECDGLEASFKMMEGGEEAAGSAGSEGTGYEDAGYEDAGGQAPTVARRKPAASSASNKFVPTPFGFTTDAHGGHGDTC